MEMKHVRRKNLQWLCKQHGRHVVAEKCGYDEKGGFNQLYAGHGSFGEKVAKNIEAGMGLPKLWMSTPHPHLWDENAPITTEEFRAALVELTAMASKLPGDIKSTEVLNAINAIAEKAKQ